MRRIIFFIVCIIVFNACSDKAYLQKFADIRYTGKDIPKPKIKINGFYVESDKINDMTIDSLKTRVIVFYDDGTFVLTFLKDSKYYLQKDKPIHLSEEIVKWGGNSQHWGQVYGLYKTSNDTIHVTMYSRYYCFTIIDRYKFKIIDSEHILLCLYERPEMKPKDYFSEVVNDEYTFVPADSIPIPDNEYWKMKKWYWENENDWKKYKKGKDN